MENNELQHWGIKGQKWGLRRFQNPDGSLTAAGKKRYADDDEDYTKRAVRGHAGPGVYLTKKRQLAGDERDLEGLNKGQHLSVGLTKERQAAFDARDKAILEERISKNETPKPKTKEEVLKSGSAKEIMKFKGDLTNKEYEDALRRLDYEKRLAAFSQAETRSALDKFSDVMGKVDTVRVGTQRALDAYSIVAKLNNTFNPKFKLPVIDGVNKAFERAEAIKKATKLESLEKDVDERGAAAMRGLTDDELKDLGARTKTKSSVFTTKKTYDNTYSDSNAKLSALVEKHAPKKVNKRAVSQAEQAKINMKKASQAKEKTKKSISSWLKSGRSVSEIAELLGISESTVRNYLEELT